MSDNKILITRKFDVAGKNWTAQCDAKRMRDDTMTCPLTKMIFMPGIQYVVTDIRLHNICTSINIDLNTAVRKHQLETEELNRHLHNVLQHICDSCIYKVKQK